MEDGSIAKTATLFPSSINFDPRASIKVDFPAPGVPDNAILIDSFLFFFTKFWISSSDSILCSSKLDSTNVIALAKALRSCSIIFF